MWDIDVAGTTAFVALGPGGLETVDVSNPALPSVLSPGVGVGSNWTTRVAVAGGRAYSNRAATLRVDAIGAGGGLTNLSSLELDDWITDIDASGSVCAVATDGAGLVAVEITPGGALIRGGHAEHRHLRAVRIAGTRAFAAASEDGLVAYDLANLGAPAKLGVKKFRKPAYALTVTGDEAVVAVGSTVLVSVKISDPANMTLNGTELNSGAEGDLPGRRAALHLAIDGQNLVKDANRFYVDALRAWFATTGRSMADLNPYEGVVIVVNGPFLRGQSGPSPGFDAGAGRVETFNAKKGVFYVASDFSWDRYAHEIVHWLGISDIYEHAFANGTILAGSAEAWCMSGSHSLGPLFTAQRTADILKWWTIGNAATDNVKQLTWSATTQLDEAFELVAHGAAADGASNRWHALKLIAASGLTYWVEVRQSDPPGLPFDQNLPIPAGQPGRVVVIRATEEKSVLDNTFERPLQLIGALTEGQQAVDAIRNLVITVESQVQADPLVQRVHVRWNQPIPDTPGWLVRHVDHAVESRHLRDGRHLARLVTRTGGYLRLPRGRRPQSSQAERRPAMGAAMTTPSMRASATRDRGRPSTSGCRATSPSRPVSATTANGSYSAPRRSQRSRATARSWSTSPGGRRSQPTRASRSRCCRNSARSMSITTSLRRTSAIFDSPSGSSHRPVILDAEVRSPFTILKRIDLLVDRLPAKWHAVVDTSYVWLDDHASAPVRTVIWTDVETWGVEHGPGERLALPTVSGWTRYVDEYRSDRWHPRAGARGARHQDRLRPRGGWRRDLRLGRARPGRVGCPDRRRAHRRARRDVDGSTRRARCDGRFHTSTPDAGLTMEPGSYAVQVFTGGSPQAAETESAIQVVDLA